MGHWGKLREARVAAKKTKKTTKAAKPAPKKATAKKPAPARPAKSVSKPRPAAPAKTVGLAEIAPLAQRITAMESAIEAVLQKLNKSPERGRTVDAPKVNTEVLALRADLYEIADSLTRSPDSCAIVPVLLHSQDRGRLDRAMEEVEGILDGSEIELLSVYRDQRDPWIRTTFAKFSLAVTTDQARQLYSRLVRDAETHGADDAEGGTHLLVPNKGVDAALIGDVLVVAWGDGKARMRIATLLSRKDAQAVSEEPTLLTDAKSLLKQPARTR